MKKGEKQLNDARENRRNMRILAKKHADFALCQNLCKVTTRAQDITGKPERDTPQKARPDKAKSQMQWGTHDASKEGSLTKTEEAQVVRITSIRFDSEKQKR